jgi:signal transduction histidine kinase
VPRMSVFLKIYLCFLFVTVLVAVTQVNLDRLMGFSPFPFHARATLEAVLSGYGPMALEHHLRGDQPALIDFTNKLKASTGITIYLIDEKGRDAGHRAVPQGVAVADEHVQRSGKTEFSSSQDEAVMGRLVASPNGTRFAVVGSVSEETLGPPRPPRPHGHNPLMLVARLLIVLVISGAICYWLARYLTAPVTRLREATRRFAGGELTVRIGTGIGNRKDELSELADDFDHMAERIGTLMAYQHQLLRDVSHELRSPLTRLNVAVELARHAAGPEVVRLLDRIEGEAQVLNEMIGQVLAIARLDGDMGAVPLAPLDLSDLVAEIAADADFEAHGRNRTVEVVDSDVCTVVGSRELLRRAIENVVRNGVVYTGEKTTVEIRLRRVEEGGPTLAEISVRDHGQGVPESELPHLFRPFYRVSTARERHTGGTGLGLAITERALRLHQGSVTASNAPGGGLLVVMRLPLEPGRL